MNKIVLNILCNKSILRNNVRQILLSVIRFTSRFLVSHMIKWITFLIVKMIQPKKDWVCVVIISIRCFWAEMYTNNRKRTFIETHTWTCHRRHLIPQMILDVLGSVWNVESCCWIQLNVTIFENKTSRNVIELVFCN